MYMHKTVCSYYYSFLLVNLPKPTRIVSSLIVLLGRPNVADRGEHILNCLQAMGPILQDELVELWDAVIPKLLNYLGGVCMPTTIITVLAGVDLL